LPHRRRGLLDRQPFGIRLQTQLLDTGDDRARGDDQQIAPFLDRRDILGDTVNPVGPKPRTLTGHEAAADLDDNSACLF
jgi:hypothetical protein